MPPQRPYILNNMQLSEYTVKKSLLRKVTQKTVTGGYNSDENGAEVILTFIGEDIDTQVANQRAQDEVRKVLNYQTGKDWLEEGTTHEETKGMPYLSIDGKKS